MRYALAILASVLLTAGCSDSSSDAVPPKDAGPEADSSVVDANPCRPGACGVFTTPSGETIDCGGCPSGQVCGDNAQPNVCGDTCLPRKNPVACNDMLYQYDLSSDQLVEYSLDCRTDPPVDQNNCVMWQIWNPGNGPCVDCDLVYCCLPPFYDPDAGLSRLDGGNPDAYIPYGL